MSRPRPDLVAGSQPRPRPDLGAASAGKPSTPRRPITPSDKPEKSTFSAQTRTGRSLSSLTSTNVPVSASASVAARSDHVATGTGPSTTATSTPRDQSHAESPATVGKLSRTLVKSMSADKAAKPRSKTLDENVASGRERSVSKSKSTTNVKKHSKSRTDSVEKEVSKKETKTSTSGKVPSCDLFSVLIYFSGVCRRI